MCSVSLKLFHNTNKFLCGLLGMQTRRHQTRKIQRDWQDGTKTDEYSHRNTGPLTAAAKQDAFLS